MKEQNVFGLPMQVGSLEEVSQALAVDTEPTTVLVIRVADMPAETMTPTWRKRMLRTPCERCGKVCWYDPDTIPAAQISFVCTVCLPIDQVISGPANRYASKESLAAVMQEIRHRRPWA